MRTWQLGTLVAGAAGALLVACAGGTSDTSSPIRPPGAASRSLTSANVGDAGDGVANEGEVEVCKYGTDGTFRVSVGGTSTDFTIAAGTCKVVAIDRTTVLNVASTVAVVELSSPLYSLLSVARQRIDFIPNTQTDVLGALLAVTDGVGVPVNAFHGDLLVYHNRAAVPAHCTYTMGWYKNHTSSWPSGSLTPNSVFDGGQTIIDLLNTPPKGSQYIILAHQYLTALLNIQGGSSVPPAVQTALNTAEAYFAGGGPGAGDPSVDITGVSTILDNYNNGLTGPGHCDD
jgi:hypothetical protein